MKPCQGSKVQFNPIQVLVSVVFLHWRLYSKQLGPEPVLVALSQLGQVVVRRQELRLAHRYLLSD
jgi:hypothetical protein